MIFETVLHAFQQSRTQDPEQIAVTSRDSTRSYRDLDEASGHLAARLRCAGVGAGDIIPVIGARSVDLVIAIIAVAKTGAAYTPVDVALPMNRRRRMIEQCDARTAVTTDPSVNAEPAAHVVTTIASGDDYPLEPASLEDTDPCYVIFTSGTTGTPKGVVVEHHSLSKLVRWHNERFAVVPGDRTTVMSGVGFDVLQWEIWSGLAAGATIHLVDDEIRSDPVGLLDYYATHHITHAYVPTVLAPDVVAAHRPPGLYLRYLFCAGKKLYPLATDHLPYTLVDYYGPTEATVFATCRVVEPHSESRPASIGTPISDTEAFVLDDNLAAVEAGEVGELMLAGSCLARGYLNSPQATATTFIQSQRWGRRIYRTGDMARWLSDGTLEFIGRRDDQIKIRGYRIELGDIETALQQHPRVRSAAVVAGESATVAAKQLVAFVVPAPSENESFDSLVSELRSDLRLELPDYMVPAVFRPISALPATGNDKIDRSELRRLLHSHDHQPSLDPALFGTEQQRAVAAVWRDVLGHPHFGADDEFFDVGGHSMLVATLIDELGRQLGVKTYVRDLYDHGTVRAIADRLRTRSHEQLPEIDSEPVRELRDDIALPAGIDFTGEYDPELLHCPGHILLTGATGFVGVHLLEKLLATGPCPQVVDTLDPGLGPGKARRSTRCRRRTTPKSSAAMRSRCTATPTARPWPGSPPTSVFHTGP